MQLTPEERAVVERQLDWLRREIVYIRSYKLGLVHQTYRRSSDIKQKTQEYEAQIHKHELWVGVFERLLAAQED